VALHKAIVDIVAESFIWDLANTSKLNSMLNFVIATLTITTEMKL